MSNQEILCTLRVQVKNRIGHAKQGFIQKLVEVSAATLKEISLEKEMLQI